MANVVTTLTRPTNVRGHADGNKRVRYFDLTADTGNYTSGGFTITAASLGLKRIDFVAMSGGGATTGTSGATFSPLGVTYASDNSSFTVWLYESGASGAALAQKTNAEAFESNFTVRLRVEGEGGF